MTQVRFMSTDGGAHPPEKWALETAEQLVYIGPNVNGPTLMAATEAKLAIAKALMDHYAKVQNDERGKLQLDPEGTHASDLGVPDEHMDSMIDAVKGALTNTPWSDIVDLPDNRAVIQNHVHEHVKAIQAIERSYNKDREAV